MTNSSWQDELDLAVDRRHQQMVAVRRHLHAHPEPSHEEHETSLYLYRLLTEEGVEVQMGPEGRGVVADDSPARDCSLRRIAIRADIDALRIHDQKQVEYRSQREGVMHACGHDAHSATVLGAILALGDMARDGRLPWPVCWRGIFQPAEETSAGACEMIESGVLEGVDAILATHVDPSRHVGRIGLRTGVLTANCDEIRLTIIGQGGHAARPHESHDPIAAAAQLISSMYLFVPRATDSLDAVVVTVGQIITGQNPNVIPERVELRGTVRTLDATVRKNTLDHLAQLARGIAVTSSTRIDLEFGRGAQSVRNDAQLVRLLRQAGEEVLGQDRIEEIPRPSMGSEDFAFYLDHVPGAMFRLGCASQQVGSSPLHSPTFDVDERALAAGAKILARAAVSWSRPRNPPPREAP